MTEASLAHQANRHDPSGHTHVDARIFELLRSLVRIVREDLRNGVRELVLAAVRELAKRLDLFHLLAPQFVNIFVECQESPLTANCASFCAEVDETLKRDYKQPAPGGAPPTRVKKGRLRLPMYYGTLVPMTDDSKLLVERVQTGVRMEKRLLKVLKAFAEYHDMTLGDLLEGIVLHAFDGKTPFSPASLERIQELKRFYDFDLDSSASHRLKEIKARPGRRRSAEK